MLGMKLPSCSTIKPVVKTKIQMIRVAVGNGCCDVQFPTAACLSRTGQTTAGIQHCGLNASMLVIS